MEETKLQTPETKRVLATSIYVDIFNLVLSLVLVFVTGSAIIAVAALQSFAELASESMLLFGRRYVSKRPTKLHPFGFGKELYYWLTLAVFVLIAAVAVVAVGRGYGQLLHPEKIHHIIFGIVGLAIMVAANLFSFRQSFNKLLEGRSPRDVLKVFNTSPLIAAKTTAVLDVMGVTTGIIGIIGLTLYLVSGSVIQLEGVGAIIMGVALAAFAIIIPLSVRTFVTGQSAPPETERRIRDAARDIPEVKHVLGLRTMILSSDKILVDIDVHLRDGMSTDQVEATVERVKEAIEKTGDGMRVHVEPDPYEDVHSPRS